MSAFARKGASYRGRVRFRSGRLPSTPTEDRHTPARVGRSGMARLAAPPTWSSSGPSVWSEAQRTLANLAKQWRCPSQRSVMDSPSKSVLQALLNSGPPLTGPPSVAEARVPGPLSADAGSRKGFVERFVEDLGDCPRRRLGDHLSERCEELGEVRRMEVGVQTVEACPFLDEDERVGCLDSLVDDLALAGVLGARWRRRH
jgi:hypothetical protein